jgi:hypothetical protein
MKLRLAVLAVLLAAPGLVSCGGDDDSESSSRSKQSLCTAVSSFNDARFPQDLSDIEGAIDELRDAGGRIGESRPADLPDDVGVGVDAVLQAIDDLPDDPLSYADLQPVFSFGGDDDMHAVAALFNHCGLSMVVPKG